MELQVGQAFDEFHIEAKIGSGSFSKVYLAHDRILGRRVVLKQLSPELTADDNEWDAFINEAQVTAAFFHPGLLAVYGLRVNEDTSSAVLVLEYMDGGTLRDMLNQNGHLALSQLWNLAYQIGNALHYLHQRGIIHRDIKPENILYSNESDWFKLADFGLVYNPKRPQFEALNDGQPGTLRYMSPEQSRNDFIDARSDQYTFAAVLLEACTGKYYLGINDLDFTDEELITYLQTGYPIRLPALHPEAFLVDKLEDVLLRALSKDPTRRYSTTLRFVQQFTRVVEYMLSSPDSTSPSF